MWVVERRIASAHWLMTWISIQWAITLGLIPILVAMFQQVSLVSPLANAFAIPLISLIVVPLTLVGSILPVDWLLQAAHEVMTWCGIALTWMSNLPAGVWTQHAPPTWAIAIAIGGVLWILLPRGFPRRWLGVVFMLPLFLILPIAPSQGEVYLTILDVGQGLAVVAQTRQHSLVFDAGPRFTADSDAGNKIVVPFLRALGISQLDTLVVSHSDSDHSGGAQSILQAIPVTMMLSSLPQQHPLMHQASNSARCYAGQTWHWDGVDFEFLHPNSDAYFAENVKDNAMSCVLKITTPSGSVLLPADIEKESEAQLLMSNAAALKSDIMVAPHHGSGTSSSI